jgi:hypothetical protein
VTREEAFRTNERAIEELGALTTSDDREPIEIACECLDPSCEVRISLTRGEYALLRATPEDFAVAEGHEQPPRDEVVDVAPGFLTVEDQETVPPHLRSANIANPS